MLKRYYAFCGHEYYADGGWDDFKGSFDLIADARNTVAEPAKHDSYPGDWWGHVVDSYTGEKLADSADDPPGEPVDEQFSDEPLPPAEAEEIARLRDKIATVRPPPAPGLSAVTVARAFEVMLPAHKASLTLTHNEHKNYYETVAQTIKDDEEHDIHHDWVSPVEMQKAIETDEMWVLQWYPETPIGSHSIAAASLPALAAWLEDNGLAFGS